MRQPTRSTPKVFNANYRPPRKFDWSSYVSLRAPLIVVAVIAGIILVSRLPFFQIKTVEVTGTTDTSIIDEINTLTGRSIFSHTISTQITTIKAKDVAISDIRCSRGIPATLKCSVVLRQPVAVWRSGGNGYIVDRSGAAYKTLTDEANILVIDDRMNTIVTIGTNVMSEDLLATYQQVSDTMKTYGFIVKNLFVTESLYQFGAVVSGRTTPDQPYIAAGDLTVLLTVNYPIEAQIKTLRQTLQDRSASIKERVDLRVPGYLYYY